MSLPGQLTPTPRLLLGPGPSDVHPRVLTVMSTPLMGHLDPQFLVLMNEVQDMLRQAYQTKNPMTLSISATGMAGMETCLVNLLEPGDKMLACVKGFFGNRLVEVGSRTGAEVIRLDAPWGQVFDLNQLEAEIKKHKPKVVGIVHAETSTGAWQPLEELGKICRANDALLLVDAVTSLGCVPLAIDAWGIDAVYSCTQKGLGCPPGLSPISFSPRALEAIAKRKTPVQSWYFDMSIVQKYWGQDRFYHHTAPITMLFALREGLRILLEEGLQPRWDRHLKNHRALKAGLLAMGLDYSAVEGHQLPQLNAVKIPAGIDDLSVRKRLLDDFGIEFGGGLGDFKGKVWRIGIMGYNSRPSCVLLALAALEQCLMRVGYKVQPGAGVAAANKSYVE
ncbi:MAG: alanine--glyoxylate aminotransferase family protein [Planctomycetota bacterium]|jgi:alanine-glyoxylate transaminase/serine-glyoxylate transaminase/serine-pyruvate transaminase